MEEEIKAESKKRCVACMEEIHASAKICPLCQTSQLPKRWKLAGDVLKWSGGIAVVISLIIAMSEVSTLFKSWQEKEQSVAELVKAAEIQSDSRDYQGAWEVLEEAMTLKPGSRLVRQQQIELAMIWLRNITIIEDQKFSDIVKKLKPKLYLGVASRKGVAAADVYAHLGWANYLQHRDGIIGVEVDKMFERSLELDDKNVFAHSMWGFWMHSRWGMSARWGELSLEELFKKSMDHFSVALETGREREFVRGLQLSSLDLYKTPLAVAAVDIVNRMRMNDEPLSKHRRKSLLEIFHRAVERESDGKNELIEGLLSVLKPQELMALYLWLHGDSKQDIYGQLQKKYITARLTEAAGDFRKALSLYETLYEEAKDEASTVKRYLPKAIQRICSGQPEETVSQFEGCREFVK
jgi:tetratricopeptide (TPR) repeat protein